MKRKILTFEEQLERINNKKNLLTRNGIPLIKLFNQVSYQVFNDNRFLYWRKQKEKIYTILINDFGIDIPTIECMELLNNSYYKRLRRLRLYIEYMFYYSREVYFLTLTFRDDVLNSTSELTRRRYIQRSLNDYSSYYCANIDYGAQNEREHYHACVVFKNINTINLFKELYSSKFGFLSIQKVGKSYIDKERLSKYINKLTNHAFKDTTIAKRVIYSKNEFIYLPSILS